MVNKLCNMLEKLSATKYFHSNNLSSYTQPAGNQIRLIDSITDVGSSETARTASCFNFNAFRDLYAKFGYTNIIDNNWLTWFVGFAEGNGRILCNNGRLRFVLTQKEGAILYKIQAMLGFGKVYRDGDYFRYQVGDMKGVLLLCVLFNGNLVLPYRIGQLSKWVLELNAKMVNIRSKSFGLHKALVHITIPRVPTLLDA
jgi:hypothetical protein